MERSDVEKLAHLARIAISPKEADELLLHFDSILEFVSQVAEEQGRSELATGKIAGALSRGRTKSALSANRQQYGRARSGCRELSA